MCLRSAGTHESSNRRWTSQWHRTSGNSGTLPCRRAWPWATAMAVTRTTVAMKPTTPMSRATVVIRATQKQQRGQRRAAGLQKVQGEWRDIRGLRAALEGKGAGAQWDCTVDCGGHSQHLLCEFVTDLMVENKEMKARGAKKTAGRDGWARSEWKQMKPGMLKPTRDMMVKMEGTVVSKTLEQLMRDLVWPVAVTTAAVALYRKKRTRCQHQSRSRAFCITSWPDAFPLLVWFVFPFCAPFVLDSMACSLCLSLCLSVGLCVFRVVFNLQAEREGIVGDLHLQSTLIWRVLCVKA